jgi:hypothetical protein
MPARSEADLDDLLAGLHPDRRQAFVLTQLLGLSYEEAAEVCACPVGTIRSRWPGPAAIWWAGSAPARRPRAEPSSLASGEVGQQRHEFAPPASDFVNCSCARPELARADALPGPRRATC